MMTNAEKLLFISAADEPWGAERSLAEITGAMRTAGADIEIWVSSSRVKTLIDREHAPHPPCTVIVPTGKSRIATVMSYRQRLGALSGRRTVVIFSLFLLPVSWLSPRHSYLLDLHDTPSGRLDRMVVTLGSYFTDGVIAISQYVASWLRPNPWRGGRLRVVPRPIPQAAPDSVNTTRRLIHTAEGPVIGLVGRVDPDKNVEFAIRAVAAMRTTASLHIFGDASTAGRGDYVHEMRALAALVAPRSVVFRGNQLASHIYEGINALLVTNPKEPNGRTVGEAIAYGVPVVVPDQGGAAEQVEDGVTGLLFPAGDITSAADALDALLSDEALYRTLSENGPRVAASRSVDRVAEQYLAAIVALQR